LITFSGKAAEEYVRSANERWFAEAERVASKVDWR
jgi:hypothetical protein